MTSMRIPLNNLASSMITTYYYLPFPGGGDRGGRGGRGGRGRGRGGPGGRGGRGRGGGGRGGPPRR